MHRIGVREHRGDKGVPSFVVGGKLLLLFRKNVAPPLGTEHHLLYRADEVELRDLGPILARRKYRRLVHQRVEISARETGGTLGDKRQIYVLGERFLTGVD